MSIIVPQPNSGELLNLVFRVIPNTEWIIFFFFFTMSLVIIPHRYILQKSKIFHSFEKSGPIL